jgi:hypothetical protein
MLASQENSLSGYPLAQRIDYSILTGRPTPLNAQKTITRCAKCASDIPIPKVTYPGQYAAKLSIKHYREKRRKVNLFTRPSPSQF